MRTDAGGRSRCANCGLEVQWKPVVVEGKAYCCWGCARGGPCYCSYDPPEQMNLPVAARDDEPEDGLAASYLSGRRSR